MFQVDGNVFYIDQERERTENASLRDINRDQSQQKVDITAVSWKRLLKCVLNHTTTWSQAPRYFNFANRRSWTTSKVIFERSGNAPLSTTRYHVYLEPCRCNERGRHQLIVWGESQTVLHYADTSWGGKGNATLMGEAGWATLNTKTRQPVFPHLQMHVVAQHLSNAG